MRTAEGIRRLFFTTSPDQRLQRFFGPWLTKDPRTGEHRRGFGLLLHGMSSLFPPGWRFRGEWVGSSQIMRAFNKVSKFLPPNLFP